MKKSYSAPYAEKINFNYKEQVVASPGDGDGGKSSCYYETQGGTHSIAGCGVGESKLVG